MTTAKTVTREKGSRWCRLEVLLEDGRLSICGSEGSIVTEPKARAQARRYWESFFEENPSEIFAMNEKCGARFSSAKGAAKFVLESDGEFHGLDISHQFEGRVYLTESAGQIVESLRQWFPEVVPYLKWHLNDMKAECVHQEARGETWILNPSAVCPDCGYKLGSAWLKRELPPEVIAWVETLGTNNKPPIPPKVRRNGVVRS